MQRRSGAAVLTVRREGDAWPGYAFRALNWYWRDRQICGAELGVTETAYGYRGMLGMHVGTWNIARIMRRGPWRWCYRRWGVAKARKERAENEQA